MSGSLIAGVFWVLAAAATAMLPFRRQFAPGITLLVMAPFLIAWVFWDHGIWIGMLALAAFASMFRNPLIYLGRKYLGLPVRRPGQGKEKDSE